MKSTKIFIALAFLYAFAICVSAQNSKSPKTLKLSVSDKTEIINQIFDDGFEKLMESLKNSPFQTCLIPQVENEQVIFISTKIEKDLVKPDFEGYRFIVMSETEMRKQIEIEKGECYFRITPFVVKASKVNVILARHFNLPAYIFGIGFRYEFEKVNGKWEKHVLGNYKIQS